MVSTASSSKEIDMSRRWWYLVVIDRNYYTELENNESLKNNENKRAKSIRSTSSISSTSLCDNTTQAEMKINETSKQPSLYGKVMAYYGTNTVWENDLSLWRFSPFIYYCMLLLNNYSAFFSCVLFSKVRRLFWKRGHPLLLLIMRKPSE